MRDSYEVVIIGGGIIGSAIGFNLLKMGVKDICVIEKSYVSSGSTGRCAGGIRQQWSSPMNVRLAMRSVELFKNFEKDVGMDIEYKQGGYLLLAYTPEEEEDFVKNVEMQRSQGLDVEILSKSQIKSKFGFMNLEGVRIGSWCQSDGHANPQIANIAYSMAIKRMGGDFITHTKVESIDIANKKIVGVQTDRGYIRTNTVVNAAGFESSKIGKMVNVDIPVYGERHQILVTEPVNHFLDPLVINFNHNYYIRQTKHGSLLMGQGDANPMPGEDLGNSIEFLEEMSQKMVRDFPLLRNVHIVRQWSGAYDMSPDAQPIIDESKDLSKFIYATGFSGHGFMLAPAVGESVAEMIVHGKTITMDISNLRMDRFKNHIEIEKNVV
ncbi:MAG: FAD-dependent oxidoreductase [Mesoaciditoga sp.]|uniref:NAD(P)/FAD-dependent oxidoreductase n=1 Tax=Athalassotoga sp. TaxID=2022597 RepID=UPI000CB47643|nr:MAG: FAD-dependent oxidoreductase [Mesoaciditoga sp.]HEU24525.1 FAD-binding oxidoreductase [Mesoaciditoga lauensis]